MYCVSVNFNVHFSSFIVNFIVSYRCATCCRCNKQVQSGLDLSTLEGLCESCYSLRKCPKCSRLYEPGDLLIKCHHCQRWFHGPCEGHCTEEEVDNASENAFRCSLCRPKMHYGYREWFSSDLIPVQRKPTRSWTT